MPPGSLKLFDGWLMPSQHMQSGQLQSQNFQSEEMLRERHIAVHLRESSPGGESCGIVNVADGCNGSCSYCIVSKARGRLKSRPVEDVVIQISAQDTAAFGSDIGSDLAGLLETLTEIPGDFMLRVGMMNPDSARLIQDRLIEAFQSPKIYRFLHIPVQSGSDEILQRMGRGYTSDEFFELVSAFRFAYPDSP